MSVFSRIGDLFRMFFSFFLEGAEESVPPERRLAYDRTKRAENLKKQMGAAEDVGAAAEMMVQQLAEARIMAANVRHEAKVHLEAAAAAAHRGDTVTQQREEARAAALAEELAAAEDEVAMLENLVEEALSDKREAIDMVLDQSKQLEKLARGDARLVARARMTDMRRQQMELREQMMELVPGDQSNMRARIQEQVTKDEARYRARRDVVDAMWEQKSGASKERVAQTAAGAAKLAELMAEVGYAPEPVEIAAPPVEEGAEASPMGQAVERAIGADDQED
ncbi:MAG: hypothetical protein ACK2T6_09280 [Anaerolineae bacterium]|jgi:dephospho-CoA kinase